MSNKAIPTNGSTAGGSIPTSGRINRPGSQARLTSPTTIATPIPIAFIAGDAKAYDTSSAACGRRIRWLR